MHGKIPLSGGLDHVPGGFVQVKSQGGLRGGLDGDVHLARGRSRRLDDLLFQVQQQRIHMGGARWDESDHLGFLEVRRTADVDGKGGIAFGTACDVVFQRLGRSLKLQVTRCEDPSVKFFFVLPRGIEYQHPVGVGTQVEVPGFEPVVVDPALQGPLGSVSHIAYRDLLEIKETVAHRHHRTVGNGVFHVGKIDPQSGSVQANASVDVGLSQPPAHFKQCRGVTARTVENRGQQVMHRIDRQAVQRNVYLGDQAALLDP